MLAEERVLYIHQRSGFLNLIVHILHSCGTAGLIDKLHELITLQVLAKISEPFPFHFALSLTVQRDWYVVVQVMPSKKIEHIIDSETLNLR